MQKGFATLEIILAMMIFALLAGAALPNATRVLEKASLDYETKRLYSELRFAQALSRGTSIEQDDIMVGGYGKMDKLPGATVTINSLNSSIRPDSWSIRLGSTEFDPLLREHHVLRNGEKFSFTNDKLKKISFDSAGKHDANGGTLTLTTRSGRDKSSIIFDSVGRILVGRDHD